MNNNDFFHDLDDKEIEMMLKYLPTYTPNNAKNIKNKFAEKSKLKHRKISFKKLALVGIVSSVVFATTMAYAGVIDISKIYKIIFEENSEYIESHIEPLEGTNDITPVHENETPLSIQSEYDGIVMKLISAINDENALRIFATITDTKGDRLGESLDLTRWGLSQGHGGNISVVDYNNETKTATLMITSLGNDHQGNATLKVNGFSTGRELLENLPENNINVAELLKEHPKIITQDEVWKTGGSGNNLKLYEESRLLKFNELDIKFDNVDMFSISNIGFVDGLLHIQTKAMLDDTALVDGYYINAKFINSEKEVIYDSAASIHFKNDRKYGYYESNREDPRDRYTEIIYDSITNPEQLNDLSLVIDYMKSPKITEASWEFSFMIPEKVTTEFHVDSEIHINGKKLNIDMVSLSPIGITVHLLKDISDNYNHSDVVYVEYVDGTIIELSQSSIHTYESESTLIFGGHIIEIENVQSIIINDERINIPR